MSLAHVLSLDHRKVPNRRTLGSVSGLKAIQNAGLKIATDSLYHPVSWLVRLWRGQAGWAWLGWPVCLQAAGWLAGGWVIPAWLACLAGQ